MSKNFKVKNGLEVTTNVTASGDISSSGTITMLTASIGGGIFTSASLAAGGGGSSFSFTGDQFATDLKVGRDSDNHIDFTTDNVMIFKINNASELRLNATSLRPHTNNGLALGSTSTSWSDLYLAEGGFITFDNGDAVITQTGPEIELSGSGATRLNVEGDITASGNISLADDKEIRLGNGGDLRIFHDPNNSVIREDGGGDLFLQGSAIRIRENSDGGTIALFTDGAGTELRHDNVKKFETSDGGINVIGHITASGNISASGTIESTGNITTGGELSANTIVVGSTISHIGDTNTLISFGTDTLTFKAGNEAFITITEDGSQDNIVIGDGGDIDFHVKAGGDNTLFAQGSSQRIGIGTATPTSKLQVVGDITATHITASGNISASGNDHFLGGRLNIHSTANNRSHLVVKDLELETGLSYLIDSNQHGDFQLDRNSVDKVRFNTYWPAQIDNDSYETFGGLILGSDADRGDKTGFGLYVSAGPDSGSIYTKERVFIGVGGATGSNDMLSVGGNITTTSHITASGNISASGTSTITAHTGSFTHVPTINGITTFAAAGNLDIGPYNFRTRTLQSDVGTGTIPISISSTTKCTNLNADLLDDQEGSHYLDFSNFVVDDDEISGDKIEGGTIGSITITDLTATKLNVTHFTSSFITSSTIVTEGSNTFGDTIADQHTFNGHITASGNISSSGNIIGELTGIGGAVTGITSLLATDIKIGEDDETKIDFETANEIHFYANNVEQVYLADNIFGPQSDSDVDLGASGVRWKDSYFDTVTTRNLTTTGPTTIGDGNDVIQFNPRILVQGDVTASGNFITQGHITASGNISSSGTGSFTGGGVFGDRVGIGTDTPLSDLHVDEGDIRIDTANNGTQALRFSDRGTTKAQIQYKDNGETLNILTGGSTNAIEITNTQGVTFSSHITASGNISSSGTINANEYGLEGNSAIVTNSGKMTFGRFVGDVAIGKNTAQTTLKIDAHVTASGNISSSGTITMLSASIGGGIFTSASLAAGGGGGAVSAVANGANNRVTTFSSADALNGEANLTFDGSTFVVNGRTKIGTTGGISSTSHQFYGQSGDSNFFLMADADGEEIMKGEGSVGNSDLKFSFGDNAGAGNGTFFQVDEGNNKFILRNDSNNSKVGINTTAPTKELTVKGDISASGGFIGGATQNTGSYDFPGAIVGYNVQGLNVTHASYNLTTTMAVPDAGMNVCFVAPKSGIVEIEVQVLADGGSSGAADLTLGLSDNATYNAVQTYYEQGVLGFPRFDHMEVVHKWVVPSLTPGTTYKYWLGAKTTSTTGTPQLRWGGSSTGRFSDFIMKATALPSNTEIET